MAIDALVFHGDYKKQFQRTNIRRELNKVNFVYLNTFGGIWIPEKQRILNWYGCVYGFRVQRSQNCSVALGI